VSVEALRAYAEELLALHGFPGMSLAVTDREGLVSSETFGLANIDAGVAVSRETYFEFGSIGKTFTALTLLQLREEGAVDFDEPVTRYLSWFDVRSEHGPITIHHLLTHTSGLMVGADLSSNSRYDVWSLRDTEVGFPPGSRFLYSNVGYQALGFVVESLTGGRYQEALRGRILDRLGLNATDPEITNEGRHRLAIGYEHRYDDRPSRRTDPWVPAVWLETATADGSLAGTMEDLATFLRALLNRGQGLLAPGSFELMTTPAIEADDGWRYGYGLELREREGRRQLRHGGSMPGFGATMLGDIDSGLGVVVAVNSIDERDVTEDVAEAILDLYRDAVPPRVPDPLEVGNAAELTGEYSGAGGRLMITAETDRLFLDGGPLEPRGSDRFLADRPDFALYHLRFLREDGQVVAVAHGANVYRREGVASPAAPAPPREWSAYTGHYRAYNPWYSNFRVVLREGELIMIFPWGLELALEPLPDGSFRAGDEWSPERLRFDAIVDDAALRVDFTGERFYRLP
jgi:CubicO group peptidase (beta-lactamase class C family)